MHNPNLNLYVEFPFPAPHIALIHHPGQPDQSRSQPQSLHVLEPAADHQYYLDRCCGGMNSRLHGETILEDFSGLDVELGPWVFVVVRLELEYLGGDLEVTRSGGSMGGACRWEGSTSVGLLC
ncbi:hypothetical protein KC19_2G051500 [Ceratodon purpureus]|uniref:Uncharacterized protein n=1 Tax=Ceratodon purpureus TaxID=3225 RepID=A0A8T0ITF7_CERPU|nr:hypothetical protein KC19_2G051500 [Ceratodon purpureus]